MKATALAAAAAFLAAWAQPPEASLNDTVDARLTALVANPGAPGRAAAGAALAVIVDGELLYSGAAGTALFEADGLTPARALTPDAQVRAASISKLATALTAGALAEAGRLDLDADARALLGYDPRTGADYRPGEGAPVTLRQMLAHTSGICDPAAYWAALGERLRSLIPDGAACDHAPGEGWAYANINYGFAAEAMEHAAGARFDQLARELVLAPAGVEAGFNWSGVPSGRRAGGAALHRFDDGAWRVQIDGAEALNDTAPAILTTPGADLADYRPGTNGALFSPQGGLRASAVELARLVSLFLPGGPGEALAAPVDVAGGEPETGVLAWGSGPQILTPGQIPGRPGLSLVGHSGEAYGLYGGAWADPETGAAIAFFVTGTVQGVDAARGEDGLTGWEEELLETGLAVVDAHREPG